jgi:putative transposase
LYIGSTAYLQRHGSHTVSHLPAHIVWVAKYRYKVLQGDIQRRCRELLIQVCDAEDVKILKGVVSKDHVHMHREYAGQSPSATSRILQMEYPELKKQYWGKHFWAIGYGVWSTGNITDEMAQEYLDHRRTPSNQDNNPIILE